MFLLYAVVVGIVLGFLLGGRLSGLASLDSRWAPLALAGLAVQVLLCSAPIIERRRPRAGHVRRVDGDGAGRRAPQLPHRSPLVALGAASNMIAIVANGGYMPSTERPQPRRLACDPKTCSNGAIVDSAVLTPLTDVFALPTWLPIGTYAFSVGDLLISIGVAMAIVVAMRRGRAQGDAEAAEAADAAERPDGPPGAWRNLPRTENARVRTIVGWSRVRLAPLFRFTDDERPPHSKNCPGQTRREAGTQSQGSRSISRSSETARLPVPERNRIRGNWTVKANLGHFATALAFPATMALSLGAGARWGSSHENVHGHPVLNRGLSRSAHGPLRGTSLDLSSLGHVNGPAEHDDDRRSGGRLLLFRRHARSSTASIAGGTTQVAISRLATPDRPAGMVQLRDS